MTDNTSKTGKMTKPRVGFLGLNEVARSRMESLLHSGMAEVVAVSDDNSEAVAEALSMAPKATNCPQWEKMLELGLDGIIISTPTVWQTDQALKTLQSGIPAFCQRPLGLNLDQVTKLIEASHSCNRLLTVDLGYRYVEGVQRIRELVLAGDLGVLYGVEMRSQQALSPDEAWCHDVRSAGGGCLIDQGVPMIDALLWMTGSPVQELNSQTLSGGRPYIRSDREVEDYAVMTLVLESGTVAYISCAWNLHVGAQSRFEMAFYGTHGAAVLRNINGSPYQFQAKHCVATQNKVIADKPDDWTGKCLLAWVDKIRQGPFFDPEIEEYLHVAHVVESVYNQPPPAVHPPQ